MLLLQYHQTCHISGGIYGQDHTDIPVPDAVDEREQPEMEDRAAFSGTSGYGGIQCAWRGEESGNHRRLLNPERAGVIMSV